MPLSQVWRTIIGDMMSGTADDILLVEETQALAEETRLVFQESQQDHGIRAKTGSKEQLLYRIVSLKGNVVTNGTN